MQEHKNIQKNTNNTNHIEVEHKEPTEKTIYIAPQIGKVAVNRFYDMFKNQPHST